MTTLEVEIQRIAQTEKKVYTPEEYLEFEVNKDDKFAAYRSIPSFQEYLLIDQYEMHVEQYFKTDGNSWIFSEYDDAKVTISLKSLSFGFTLADIYDKVDFESD
jgi:Uma2 family endonuclease